MYKTLYWVNLILSTVMMCGNALQIAAQYFPKRGETVLVFLPSACSNYSVIIWVLSLYVLMNLATLVIPMAIKKRKLNIPIISIGLIMNLFLFLTQTELVE
jgi:hypothetical protein